MLFRTRSFIISQNTSKMIKSSPSFARTLLAQLGKLRGMGKSLQKTLKIYYIYIMSKKYELDTNLLYHLSGLATSGIGKPASEIEKNLTGKVFYVSEWSIIEILTTNKSLSKKEKIIHMLIDKEIPIMPIYSEYTELPKIFSNIYSSNNYTRLDIPKNEFHA